MNDFKDKITKRERLYVYITLLIFLVGFGFFLLQLKFNPEAQFEVLESSGVMSNLLGAVILGYGLSAECTIIHCLLGAIRKSNIVLKVLLIILFIPAMMFFLVPSYIGTIPYLCYSVNKINRIKMDNNGVLSKAQIISLIVFLIADLSALIVFFVL